MRRVKLFMGGYLSYVHNKYVKPRSLNEDDGRREYIFNVLLLGMTALSLVTFLVSFGRFLAEGYSEDNIKPVFLGILVAILVLMYAVSRKKFGNLIVYVFVATFLLLGSYGLYLYSYVLPQGLLIYALVIVMSGILISAKSALIITIMISLNLCILSYMQINEIIHPRTAELNDPMRMNLAVYIFIFFTIYLVSWLYSREIRRSLARARKSEALLTKERDSLETKVKQRARELEKIQIEKSRELYRFAEFGRFSSSVIHDLANPLTAVSLNLGSINGKTETREMKQIRAGVSHMESYVESARRQLNNQSENKIFDSRDVINQVISFTDPKAKASKVKVRRQLQKDAKLHGNSSKFSQIISNLIGNAIDAYEDKTPISKRSIYISSSINSKGELIVAVQENGRGISRSELERIFEPFFSTKPGDRGTGIGLTITKRIIEEDFNGRIEAKSSKEMGTVFTVTLPTNRRDNHAG